MTSSCVQAVTHACTYMYIPWCVRCACAHACWCVVALAAPIAPPSLRHPFPRSHCCRAGAIRVPHVVKFAADTAERLVRGDRPAAGWAFFSPEYNAPDRVWGRFVSI